MKAAFAAQLCGASAPADVDGVRRPLQAIAPFVVHLGPVGSGQLAKACNQIVIATALTALAEAVALGAQGGLQVHQLLDVLAGDLAGSRAREVKRAKLESHSFQPGGSASFQHKDLGFALEAARAEGVAWPAAVLVDQLFGAMRRTGHGEDDHNGILQIIWRLSQAVTPGSFELRLHARRSVFCCYRRGCLRSDYARVN